MEDAGQSINPLVDIGQVEGAFVMGIGLWTSERVVYDPETGRKLSAGPWNYKPPVNRDIPIDFRVALLKNAGHSSGVYRSKGNALETHRVARVHNRHRHAKEISDA